MESRDRQELYGQYQSDDEYEINLISLTANILRKWQSILIWGLVFCALAAGFQAFRSRKNDVQYQKSYAEYLRQRSNYQSTINTYERERIAVQADIDDIYAYLDNSVLAKINPYQEAYATADLQFEIVNSNYAIDLSDQLSVRNDEADRILGAYTSYLSSSISYQVLAEKE